MTDTLWRVQGQIPEHDVSTLVVAGGSEQIHIRNAHLHNYHRGYGGWALISKGDISVLANQIVPWTFVPPGETIKMPLDLTLEAGETIYARQINDMTNANFRPSQVIQGGSTTDGTAFTTATWGLPTGFATALLTVVSTHASAAEVPSSVVDNHSSPGTFTLIQTVLSSNGQTRISQYKYKGASSPGASASLTINFSGTMTGCMWALDEVFWGADNSGSVGANRCIIAGGVMTQSWSEIYSKTPFTDCPPGSRHVATALQSGTAASTWPGFKSLASQTIATPAASLATAYSDNPGDGFGYAAHATNTQRIQAVTCLQARDDFRERSVIVNLNGVSTI